MSERQGILMSYIVLLWCAIFVGTGRLEVYKQDGPMLGLTVAFFATLLFMGARRPAKPKP